MEDLVKDKRGGKITFERSLASVERGALDWDYKNNGDITPDQVLKQARDTYYSFICNVCKHSYKSVPRRLIRGKKCGYCADRNLCSEPNCNICLPKSFALHPLAVQWNIEENKNIKPRDVFKGSDFKYAFNCDKCNHIFYTSLNNITTNNHGCVYCANQKLCDNNECKLCEDKSFASVTNENLIWNQELNKKNPRDVFKGSSHKYAFTCKKCEHVIYAPPSKFISNRAGCVYCVGQKLCDSVNCNMCYTRSFASSEKSQFWDFDKNTINPRHVARCSGVKYYFNAQCGHALYITPSKVQSGRWCNVCKFKTETKLHDILLPIYPTVRHQFRAKWCKNIETDKYFPFDFIMEKYKIIIELDGEQHFKQVKGWLSLDNQQERDKYKMLKANENGYSVIRLLQMDVYYDRINWLEELTNSIEKIKQDGIIQNVFIAKDVNKYVNHQLNLEPEVQM
jgi:very-short-patch-repair endonuclease